MPRVAAPPAVPSAKGRPFVPCGMAVGMGTRRPPVSLAAVARGRFRRCRTDGDGACSIHAVFGASFPEGYRRLGARAFLAQTLGQTADEFKVRMGDVNLLEEVVSA
eukprot:9247105-Pyramimonas_sp.AAC.1